MIVPVVEIGEGGASKHTVVPASAGVAWGLLACFQINLGSTSRLLPVWVLEQAVGSCKGRRRAAGC